MSTKQPGIFLQAEQCPQPGRVRMIMPQPVDVLGNGMKSPEKALIDRKDRSAHSMRELLQ